jgi:uncharacterized membrane protein YfcA
LSLFAHFDPLFAASGFGVGLLVGLTGVGGGSLMTPLLILAFGIHPAAAVGTDLLYASITKAGGSLVHGLLRTIHWPLVGLLALGSLPSSLLMLVLLRHLGAESVVLNAVISRFLGVALLLTVAALIFRKQLLARYGARAGRLSDAARHRYTIATGIVLGTLVTVSSVGAGALGVTALLLLYPRLETARIVGSDIAHAVPLTLVAGAGHLLLGHIDFAMLGSLLVGSLPGITIASSIAPRLPEQALRYALAGVLVLVAVRLLA